MVKSVFLIKKKDLNEENLFKTIKHYLKNQIETN